MACIICSYSCFQRKKAASVYTTNDTYAEEDIRAPRRSLTLSVSAEHYSL
jgi:hypothetical protein